MNRNLLNQLVNAAPPVLPAKPVPGSAPGPRYELRNGILFVNGKRATAEEVAAYNARSPYVSQNWLAQSVDGRELGKMPPVSTAPLLMPPANVSATSPIIRMPLPAQPPSLASAPLSAPVTYNQAAGARPLLNSLLGVPTRSGQVRKSS